MRRLDTDCFQLTAKGKGERALGAMGGPIRPVFSGLYTKFINGK